MNTLRCLKSANFSPKPKIIVIVFFSFSLSAILNIFSISFSGLLGHILSLSFGVMHSTVPQMPCV